jgi:hypothetical protein
MDSIRDDPVATAPGSDTPRQTFSSVLLSVASLKQSCTDALRIQSAQSLAD